LAELADPQCSRWKREEQIFYLKLTSILVRLFFLKIRIELSDNFNQNRHIEQKNSHLITERNIEDYYEDTLKQMICSYFIFLSHLYIKSSFELYNIYAGPNN